MHQFELMRISFFKGLSIDWNLKEIFSTILSYSFLQSLKSFNAYANKLSGFKKH